MKVGTDAVLLGAWANLANVKNILEVGTGSGIISLMLAQRTSPHVQIVAIEIEKEDAQQARENILRSPWPDKITVHHQSLQDFKSNTTFDLIVSNPPYFINSHLPPSTKRSVARHAKTLTYPELILNAKKMLAPSGRLAIVLPFEEGKQFQSLASRDNLKLVRLLAFYSRAGKPQERWLFEFGQETQPFMPEVLVLHGTGEEWSADYKNLTRDFYLKL